MRVKRGRHPIPERPERTSAGMRRATKDLFDEIRKRLDVGSETKLFDKLAKEEAHKLNIPITFTSDGYAVLANN